MNILITTDYFHPYIGGAEISAYNLAKALATREHRVWVLTRPKKGIPEVERVNDNLIVYRSLKLLDRLTLRRDVVLWKPANYSVYTAVTKFARKHRVDIIHAQNRDVAIGSIRAALKLNVPSVVTVRDYWPICHLRSLLGHDNCPQGVYKCIQCHAGQGRNFLKKLVYLVWAFYATISTRHAKSLIKKASTLITVSEYVKKVMGTAGVHQEIHHVPNIVDLNAFQYMPGNNNQILFAGGLIKEKGITDLIESAKILRDDKQYFQLKIAGEGPLKDLVGCLIDRYELMDCVELVGKVHPNEMANLYSSSQIVVLPSNWPEPLSRVLLEACASSKPMVATDTGGTAEVVIDELNGFLSPPNAPEQLAEKIGRLLSDEELRNRMGKEARRIAEQKFDEKIVVEKVIDVYQSQLRAIRPRKM